MEPRGTTRLTPSSTRTESKSLTTSTSSIAASGVALPAMMRQAYPASAEVSQCRPFPGPRLARPPASEDRSARLVVVDAGLVLDPGRERAAAKPPIGVRRIEADGDQRPCAVGRPPPLPIRVVAAVGTRQSERGSVAVDRSGLPV